jgi:hypothetical protein
VILVSRRERLIRARAVRSCIVRVTDLRGGNISRGICVRAAHVS